MLALTAPPPRMTLSAEPRMANAPTGALIRVHVLPSSTYQVLTVLVEGPNYYSRSDEDIPLDRPYWLRREIRALPEGDYAVVAMLTSPSAPLYKRTTLERR